MSSREINSPAYDLCIDRIYETTLSAENYAAALELHEYILQWVLTPGNLTTHSRAIFMHACGQGNVRVAMTTLMREFSRPDSVIPPSEPVLWTAWAEYWQRGFDPPRH